MNFEIIKIKGKMVQKSKGNVEATYEELKEKGMVVGISESQLLVWLFDLKELGFGIEEAGQKYSELRKRRYSLEVQVEDLKEKNDQELQLNKKIEELQNCENAIRKIKLIDELIQVDYKSDVQFREEFTFNGVKYKWLNSKGDSTNTYIKEGLFKEIDRRLHNGRNEKNKFIPAKLNAYIGLALSSSTRISDENQPRKVIVVNDNVTVFKETYLDVTTKGVKPVTDNVELEASDGNGVIDYRLLEKWSKEDLGYEHISSGVSVRSAFLKGMVFPVDLQKFFKQHQVTHITDIWGTTHSIEDIDVIIPTSMLKLWQSYESYEDYERNCTENGYKWRVCKESHDIKASRTNYQMLTDLVMTDEQIQAFIKPTIDYLQDVAGRDWLSTVLYLNGQTLSETSTNVKGMAQALMIEPELRHDKSVVRNVNYMLNKRKNDACLGKLHINSDYQIISSDLYNFLCSTCGIESKGLLKAGEIYSRWHLDRNYKEALLFRSPMIEKHNIAIANITDSEELRDFYEYMPHTVVLNDWDCIAMTLAGADKDGDSVVVATDETLLEVYKQLAKSDEYGKILPCICETCESNIVKKVVCGREELLTGAKIGCSNKYNIGVLINKVTAQFSVRSMFKEGSKEYKELSDRILLGLMYSQSFIDSKKLGCAFNVPEHWFSLKECDKLDCSEEEREFQKRICTQGKKPYFMVMHQKRSKNEKKRYKASLKEIDFRSKCYWGISAKELLAMSYDEMNDEQRELVEYWSRNLPCYMKDNSTMHRICIATEKAIENTKCNSRTKDCSDLMKNTHVAQGDADIEDYIDKKLNEYDIERKKINSLSTDGKDDKEVKFNIAQKIKEKQEQFKFAILEECQGNTQLALNCLINVCNKRNNSFNMIWLFTDEIVENLLERNDYKMQIPVQDDEGNLEYQSRRFKVVIVDVRENNDEKSGVLLHH